MDVKSQVVSDIRSFNRFYTDLTGLMDKYLLQSEYSLVEVRIMFEINHARTLRASQIMGAVSIDKSYLSRLLKKLERERLIVRRPSAEDARATTISLSERGQQTFRKLNTASNEQIQGLIQHLTAHEQNRLVAHMRDITHLLTK